jgi:hypothetical protein
MERLKNIIRNRTVAILAHGASIAQLENHIEDLKDKDACYATLNFFPIMEEFILSKINKKLDIVFDCSTVARHRQDEFDLVRMKRLDFFLQRPDNNLWITSHGIVRDNLLPSVWNGMYHNNRNKILEVDTLFPPRRISEFMSVPGSISLLIASCIAGQAKKIIMFGFDGCNSLNLQDGLNTYYKHELQKEERFRALGSIEDVGVTNDTFNFQMQFPSILNKYRSLFNNDCIIENCSRESYYSIFNKISYNDLKQAI